MHNQTTTNQGFTNNLPEPHNVADWERLLCVGVGTFVVHRSYKTSALATMLGALLIGRGIAGRDPVYSAAGISTAPSNILPGEVELTRVVTIDTPKEELYDFFLNQTEKFGAMMEPVTEVVVLDDDRYAFEVKSPIGVMNFVSRVSAKSRPNSFQWESEQGSIAHQGEVTFTTTPRGTEVRVAMTYFVPGGRLTDALARLSGMGPKETLERALKQLKAKFETGEIPTVEGQPMGAGREHLKRKGATI